MLTRGQSDNFAHLLQGRLSSNQNRWRHRRLHTRAQQAFTPILRGNVRLHQVTNHFPQYRHSGNTAERAKPIHSLLKVTQTLSNLVDYPF